MPIDNCRYRWDELVSNVVPRLFAGMQSGVESGAGLFRVRDIATNKSATKSALAFVREPKDFSGCYVLYSQNKKPFYVGISRRVISRLVDHVHGEWSNHATLAFSMARMELGVELRTTRSLIEKHPNFNVAFTEAKRKIRDGYFSFMKVEDDPVCLCLLEVYTAMELDTSAWNSFRTH